MPYVPDLISVKAAPGIKVPREDKPTVCIDDATPVRVVSSVYYHRRVADGDLMLLGPAEARAATLPAGETIPAVNNN